MKNIWSVFLLLLVVTLPFSCEYPTSDLRTPKTMYEALLNKCPKIEKTNLKDSEILTKCSNWTAINATNEINRQTQENVLCLVYYESIVSFCTLLNDSWPSLLPTSKPFGNDTLETVCQKNFTFFPVNKTLEHNVTGILEKLNCYSLCGDFTAIRINPICNYIFYFANYNYNTTGTTILKEKTTLPPSSTSQVPNNVNQTKAVEAGNDSGPLAQQVPIIKEGIPISVQDGLATNVSVVKDVIPKKKKPTLAQADTHNPEDINMKKDDSNEPNESTQKSNAERLQETEVKEQKQESNPEDNQTNLENVKENSVGMEPDQENWYNKEEELIEKQDQRADDPEAANELPPPTKKEKPSTVEDEPINSYNTPEEEMDGDSYFFSYFTVLMCLFIVGYVGYHNRQKLLALILEGKRGKRTGRGRRPNSANYHKLDSNLEEAISSSCTKNPSNVIY